MPKIADYLKILTDKVKYFALINFDEYFKSTREKLYSKPTEEKNLRKVGEMEKYVELIEKLQKQKL